MKVRIKRFNGELPSYLTMGKEYDVVRIDKLLGDTKFICDDDGDLIGIGNDKCAFLNGGSWEVVD